MNFQQELLNYGGGINHEFITPQLYLHSQSLQNSNCSIQINQSNQASIHKIPSLNLSQPKNLKFTNTFQQITDIKLSQQYNTAITFFGLFDHFINLVKSIQQDPHYSYSLLQITDKRQSIQNQAYQNKPYNTTTLSHQNVYLFRADTTQEPSIAILYFQLNFNDKLISQIINSLNDDYFDHPISYFIQENQNNSSNHIILFGLDKNTKYQQMINLANIFNKIQSRPNACLKCQNYSFNVDEYNNLNNLEEHQSSTQSSKFLRATHQFNILEDENSNQSNLDGQLKKKLFNKIYQLEKDIDTIQKEHQNEMMQAELTIALLEKRVQQDTSVLSYEKDFARMETVIQNLREQITLLSAINSFDNKQTINFKQMIRNLNVDFSNQEQEFNSVRKELRKYLNDKLRSQKLEADLKKVESEYSESKMDINLLKQTSKEQIQMIDALRESLQERSKEIKQLEENNKYYVKSLETTLNILELHNKQDVLKIKREMKKIQEQEQVGKIEIIEKFRKYIQNEHIRNNSQFIDEQLDYLTSELHFKLTNLEMKNDRQIKWRKEITQELNEFNSQIQIQCGLTSSISKKFSNFVRNVLCQQLS